MIVPGSASIANKLTRLADGKLIILLFFFDHCHSSSGIFSSSWSVFFWLIKSKTFKTEIYPDQSSNYETTSHSTPSVDGPLLLLPAWTQKNRSHLFLLQSRLENLIPEAEAVPSEWRRHNKSSTGVVWIRPTVPV